MRVPFLLLGLALAACSPQQEESKSQPVDEKNEAKDMVGLGKQLFFDKRLSANGQMSCENCHLPEKGWTDGEALSKKFDGSMNTRHTPTLYNVSKYRELYWDGRAATLEKQILAAWQGQMGGAPDKVAEALNAVPAYQASFTKLAGGPADPDRIVNALAAFVRTIESKNAPWDRYEAGDKSAASADAVAGFEIFSKKANCTLCHLPPEYSDTLFHNVGIGFDKPEPDMGRGAFLTRSLQPTSTDEEKAKAESSMGAFKTPMLRSLPETAPYFHDGRAATLDAAVDLMLAGGIKNKYLDPKLKPAKLTDGERAQLIAFLQALTPEKQAFERPSIP